MKRRAIKIGLAFSLSFTVLCACQAAAADDGLDLSDYEEETLSQALHDAGGHSIHPAPEGVTIDSVEVRVLDVIEQRDPAPGFLNIFHANSRQEVIRRELLFRAGDRYQRTLVQESQRNLRDLRQLSLVLIVPLRVIDREGAEKLQVLVIVKDVWSLRLNSDYRVKNGQLEYLFLQPAEENLAGTHRRVLGAFELEPDTLSFGLRAVDPRLFGSRHQVAADGNVIVNRDSGEVEGSFGYFQYGQPLFSTRQRWSWGAMIKWHDDVTREYVGLDLRTYDAEATPEVDRIPYVYNTSVISGRYSVTRSFGSSLKHDLQLGVEANRSAFNPTDLSDFDATAAAEFIATQLPVSDTRNGPYLQYRLYQNRFKPLLDMETLSLQEDFQMGANLFLRFFPSPEIFGSTRNVFGFYGAYGHTVPLGDGFVRPYLAGSIDIDSDDGTIPDAEVQTGLRAASPRLPIGRLISDSTARFRPKNYLNSKSTLGGEGRLRGYPSALFIGKDLMSANLELRSRPLQLWTVLVAGALFYDVGDAFDGLDDLTPKQGAGFGVRVLFPQLGRAVMRVDWGFALTPQPYEISPFDGLVLTFRQAFEAPVVTGRGVVISSD